MAPGKVDKDGSESEGLEEGDILGRRGVAADVKYKDSVDVELDVFTITRVPEH
jgi:hypothetical protein